MDKQSYFDGLAAGEGCFYVARASGNRRDTLYGFSLGMNERDSDLVDELRAELGFIGNIYHNKKSKMYTFTVTARADIREVVIPYFEEYLGNSYKRIQFNRWRDGFLASCESKPIKKRQKRQKRQMSLNECIVAVKAWVQQNPAFIRTTDFLALVRPICRGNQNLAHKVKGILIEQGFLEVRKVSKSLLLGKNNDIK